MACDGCITVRLQRVLEYSQHTETNELPPLSDQYFDIIGTLSALPVHAQAKCLNQLSVYCAHGDISPGEQQLVEPLLDRHEVDARMLRRTVAAIVGQVCSATLRGHSTRSAQLVLRQLFGVASVGVDEFRTMCALDEFRWTASESLNAFYDCDDALFHVLLCRLQLQAQCLFGKDEPSLTNNKCTCRPDITHETEQDLFELE